MIQDFIRENDGKQIGANVATVKKGDMFTSSRFMPSLDFHPNNTAILNRQEVTRNGCQA